MRHGRQICRRAVLAPRSGLQCLNSSKSLRPAFSFCWAIDWAALPRRPVQRASTLSQARRYLQLRLATTRLQTMWSSVRHRCGQPEKASRCGWLWSRAPCAATTAVARAAIPLSCSPRRQQRRRHCPWHSLVEHAAREPAMGRLRQRRSEVPAARLRRWSL